MNRTYEQIENLESQFEKGLTRLVENFGGLDRSQIHARGLRILKKKISGPFGFKIKTEDEIVDLIIKEELIDVAGRDTDEVYTDARDLFTWLTSGVYVEPAKSHVYLKSASRRFRLDKINYVYKEGEKAKYMAVIFFKQEVHHVKTHPNPKMVYPPDQSD